MLLLGSRSIWDRSTFGTTRGDEWKHQVLAQGDFSEPTGNWGYTTISPYGEGMGVSQNEGIPKVVVCLPASLSAPKAVSSNGTPCHTACPFVQCSFWGNGLGVVDTILYLISSCDKSQLEIPYLEGKCGTGSSCALSNSGQKGKQHKCSGIPNPPCTTTPLGTPKKWVCRKA